MKLNNLKRFVNTALILTGAYKLGQPVYEFKNKYDNRYQLDSQNEQRIKQLYNPQGNKWALITGASEGIGRCFAIDLARSGFNVALASRSEDKLNKVKKVINLECPEIQVKVLPIDLAQSNDYSVITKDEELFSNLSLVVNNAGQLQGGPFFKISPEKLDTELKLNLNAITLLTKYTRNAFKSQIKKDLNTNEAYKRFAMIQLSSTAADFSTPNLSQYGATKQYGQHFSRVFNQITQNKLKSSVVDTLILKPGVVTTGMTDNTQFGKFTCYPEETSRETLNLLGRAKSTNGSMVHQIQALATGYTARPVYHLIRKNSGKQELDAIKQLKQASEQFKIGF